MPTNSVPVDKQYFFKTCRMPYTANITFRNNVIVVCSEHELRYGTSYEKQLASEK